MADVFTIFKSHRLGQLRGALQDTGRKGLGASGRAGGGARAQAVQHSPSPAPTAGAASPVRPWIRAPPPRSLGERNKRRRPRAPAGPPPLTPPRRRRREGLGGSRRKGPVRTCAKTVRPAAGAATFPRPWYHAAPAPASATPATAAARGPGVGTARRQAATPRRSLAPQAASRAPRAAAIFAEAPVVGRAPRRENSGAPQASREPAAPRLPSLSRSCVAVGVAEETGVSWHGRGDGVTDPLSDARQSPGVRGVPRVL